MSAYKNVAGVLTYNTKLLTEATLWGKVELLDREFARYKASEIRRRKREDIDGDVPFDPYRLHWAGDIFNEEYAQALASAIQLNSDLHFWCYTRSFFAVPYLCNIPNLTLYLSLDPVNVQHGMMTFSEHKTDRNNLQICYMSPENDFEAHMKRTVLLLREENKLREALGYAPKNEELDTALSACPVDTGKLELEYGCSKCKRCIKKHPGPVWFET
jgi:hypothetical protein